jgi:para-nitrobenzyl esterase
LNICKLRPGAAAWIASAVLGLGLAGCGGSSNDAPPPPPAPASFNPVRSTAFGQIDGAISADGKTAAWLGVPFAKPPVGPLRWQPPQDPDAWTDVKSTQAYTDACTQIGDIFSPPPLGKDYSSIWENFYKPMGSEDCLYLNIWAPTNPTTGETKLPVIVYIHGGSNVVGGATDPLINGANLATGVNAVVVTIPYRLGLLGWFAHPSFNTGDPLRDSGNFALLDLIQALKFVQNNIANFGGDPGNVTIAGQSAGSTNVNALIFSPLATGLFHKAISMSGGIGGSSMTSAVSKSNAIIDALLIKDLYATDKASADAFRTAKSDEWIKNYMMSKSADDLYAIQVDPTGGKFGTGSRTFQPGSTTAQLWSTVAPILDGTVMPTSTTTALTGGNFSKVPQLVGNAAEEGKLFSSAFAVDDYTRVKWMNGTFLGTAVGLQFGDLIDGTIINPLTVDNYNTYIFNNANHVTPAPSITTSIYLSFTNSSNKAYTAQGVPMYAYSFNWKQEPAPWNDVYGAWHTDDIAFMFGNFGLNLEAFAWTDANQPGRLALSTLMQASVGAFIRTGDPNNSALGVHWDQWTTAAPLRMQFDATLTQATVSEQ